MQSPNHWTVREFSTLVILNFIMLDSQWADELMKEFANLDQWFSLAKLGAYVLRSDGNEKGIIQPNLIWVSSHLSLSRTICKIGWLTILKKREVNLQQPKWLLMSTVLTFSLYISDTIQMGTILCIYVVKQWVKVKVQQWLKNVQQKGNNGVFRTKNPVIWLHQTLIRDFTKFLFFPLLSCVTNPRCDNSLKTCWLFLPNATNAKLVHSFLLITRIWPLPHCRNFSSHSTPRIYWPRKQNFHTIRLILLENHLYC